MKKIAFLIISTIIILSVLCSCQSKTPATNDDNSSDTTINNEKNDKIQQNITETPADEFVTYENEDGTISVKYKGERKSVVVPKEINGKLVTGISTLTDSFAKSDNKIKSIVLPDSINEISKNAFADFASLESINLPDSVKKIGARAFFNCTSLKKIKLPSSLNIINEELFAYSGIEEIELNENIESIEAYAFLYSKLKTVSIPSNVKIIKYHAFAGCEDLTSVKLNNGLETIEHKAFVKDTSLTEITIPKTVKTVTSMSFTGCSSLKKIYFEGDAPETFIYTDFTGAWEANDVDFTIYYSKDAKGFTSPEWCGYKTEIINK